MPLSHGDMRNKSLPAATLHRRKVNAEEMRGLLLAVLAVERKTVFLGDALAHALVFLVIHSCLPSEKQSRHKSAYPQLIPLSGRPLKPFDIGLW